MIITSLQNDRIKNYIKLKEKKYRNRDRLFLVEGMHSVAEAYNSGYLVELILEKDERVEFDVPHVYVTQEILNKLSSTDSPGKIIGICKMKNESKTLGNKILILDGIQDPGNLGTIIRSAKAFDIDTIVLSTDTVDLYNPKVVRSTQGILFHINIIVRELDCFLEYLHNEGIPIYGTRVDCGYDICSLKKEEKSKFALVMGNEGSGIKKEILQKCDKFIYINMNKSVESLNVAVATSIILYEVNKDAK